MKLCKGNQGVIIFSCAECDYQTKDKSNFNKHKKTHTKLLCDECGHAASSLQLLDEHKAKSHSSKMYKCDYCEFIKLNVKRKAEVIIITVVTFLLCILLHLCISRWFAVSVGGSAIAWYCQSDLQGGAGPGYLWSHDEVLIAYQELRVLLSIKWSCRGQFKMTQWFFSS